LFFEAPPNLQGILLDFWQRPIPVDGGKFAGDVGLPGPDAGKGGKFLVLPPGYKGNVPKGYYVYRSDTKNLFIFLRAFYQDPKDLSPTVKLMEQVKVYPLNLPADQRKPMQVGTVNVRSGNFVYFDNATDQIGPQHVMASGSLPPGFPATEIEGEFFWDGGLVSNTPLQWVLDYGPRQDTLVFQLDLWTARGELPRDLTEVELRQKDIRYSSRTRAATDQFKQMQMARRTAAKLLKTLPKDLLQSPEAERLAELADEKVYNLIQLIYHAKNYEGVSKDYEFSRRTMEEHWKAGYSDAVRTLRYPEVLQRPDGVEGVFSFDLAKQERGAPG
jgi:NTE family protein